MSSQKNTSTGFLFCLLTTAVCIFVMSCGRVAAAGKIVVANRASADISVIDTRTNAVVDTVALPAAVGEATPEPMYVVQTEFPHRIWVGDRANDRVVAFHPKTFAVQGTVPAGVGVFHMSADAIGQQLWVVNDVDNTATVIDPHSMTVRRTVGMPADLVADGGRPHDVVLDPLGLQAYVTIVALPGESDAVVAFNAWFAVETARADVGQDPHLSFNWRRWSVYSPNQNTNNVFVLSGFGLHERAVIDIPGAHGAITSSNGRRFYTTNISGGGSDAVFCIDTRTNSVIGEPADTPFPTPHNLAITPDGRRLYVTHSGATAQQVTVFAVSRNGRLRLIDTIEVGLNPFGLAYVR